MTKLAMRMLPGRDAEVAFVWDPRIYAGRRAVAVFLHGALRSANSLASWAERLAPAADAVFLDLPGHGASGPVEPATLDRIADNIADALAAAFGERQVVLVGESVGGLVAIAIAKRLPAMIPTVVAAEPPLSMAKQWQIRDNLRARMQQKPNDAFLRSFADEVFGLTETGQETRDYYGLLQDTPCPIHVLAGSHRLQQGQTGLGPGTVIDAEDVAAIGRSDAASLTTIAGAGHLVLIEAPEACHAVVARVLAGAFPP